MTKGVVIKNKQSHPFAGGRFRVDVVDLDVTNPSGDRVAMTRVSFERGDSVAVLVHDTARNAVILTRQFRYPTIATDAADGDGWLLELPAGGLEAGESPETCARREVEEEVGYKPDALEPICRFFVSPGGTSERITLYYAAVSGPSETGGGGIDGEDIEVLRVPVAKFLQMAADNTIKDAKTLIAALWLRARLAAR